MCFNHSFMMIMYHAPLLISLDEDKYYQNLITITTYLTYQIV